MRKLWLCTLSLFCLLLTGCNNGDSGLVGSPGSLNEQAAKLVVTPKNALVPVGMTQQMHADLELSDGQVVDVTNHSAITWSSSDDSKAKVDSHGVISGLHEGSVTISAVGINEDGNEVRDSAVLQITNAVSVGLIVTPKNSQLPMGLSQQMRADLELSNGQVVDVTNHSTITWFSSDENKAKVDNQGLVTAVREGSVTITAVNINKDGSEVRDNAVLQITDAAAVSLVVTPKSNTLSKGLSQPYKAEVQLSDGRVLDVTTNTSLTWSSSNTTVGNIDESTGIATALEVGETTITARGKVGEVSLSDTATLTVGAATISQLKITPERNSVPVGLNVDFSADAILTDKTIVPVTEQITWGSDDASIATISNVAGSKGKATGVAASSSPAIIKASVTVDGTSYSDTAELAVTNAVVTSFTISPDNASVFVGRNLDIFQAKATLSDGQTIDVTKNDAVSWTSSDAQIATVDNGSNKGVVTSVSDGSVTITATGISGGQTYSSSATVMVIKPVMTGLTISPTKEYVPIGMSKAFKATATFSDNSIVDVTSDASLSWSTSNSDIASISNATADKGTAKGITSGFVTIVATDNVAPLPITAEAELEVTPAIVTQLDVNSGTIPKGQNKLLTAIATFSDNHQEDVTMNSNVSWSSDNAAIMIVSNDRGMKGTATGIEVGTTNAVATLDLDNGSIIAGVAKQTITEELVVKSIEVSPASTSVIKGSTVNLKATATLSDGSSLDITDSPNIHWTSDNTAVATVKKGEVTGVEDSSTPANITATFDSFSGKAEVYVTEAAISSFALNWVDIDYLVEEKTRQVQVLATLSNGDTNVNITNDQRLTWSIDDTSLAKFTSNVGELKGVHYGDTATLTVSGNFVGGPQSHTLPIKVIPFYTPPFLRDDVTTIPETEIASVYTNKDGFITTPESAVNTYAAMSYLNAKEVCTHNGGLSVARDTQHLENYLRDRNSRTNTESTAQGKLGEKWPKNHAYWVDDINPDPQSNPFHDPFTVQWNSSVQDYDSALTNPVAAQALVMCENK